MNIHILFGFCIIVRIIIIILIYFTIKYKSNYRYLFVIFYAISSLGLLYHYITKYRKKGAFNQIVWWDYLRPIHIFLFLISSYLILLKDNSFVYVLLVDTLISILAHYHFY